MSFFIKLLKLLVALLLLGAGVYFALSNNHDLLVRVPVTEQMISMNVSLALFLAFVTGTCFTVLFFGYEWLRKAIDIKHLRRQLLEITPKKSESGLPLEKAGSERMTSPLYEDHSMS